MDFLDVGYVGIMIFINNLLRHVLYYGVSGYVIESLD